MKANHRKCKAKLHLATFKEILSVIKTEGRLKNNDILINNSTQNSELK